MGSRWDLVWEEAKQDAFILGFLLNLLGDEMELLGIAAWVGSTGDRIALPDTCFLWGLGLLAKQERPPPMSRGRWILPHCINIIFMTVTAGTTYVILVTVSSADSLMCLPGPVLDRMWWDPRTHSCPVNTVEQIRPPAHQDNWDLPDFQPTAQKKASGRGRESRSPSIHSWSLLSLFFPSLSLSSTLQRRLIFCISK